MAKKSDNITLASCLKKLKACKARIAKERDLLRDIQSDIETLEGDCTEALDNLTMAVDTISQQV